MPPPTRSPSRRVLEQYQGLLTQKDASKLLGDFWVRYPETDANTPLGIRTDPNTRPLDLVVREGSVATLAFLLEQGALSGHRHYSRPLAWLIRSGGSPKTKDLVEKMALLLENGESPVHYGFDREEFPLADVLQKGHKPDDHQLAKAHLLLDHWPDEPLMPRMAGQLHSKMRDLAEHFSNTPGVIDLVMRVEAIFDGQHLRRHLASAPTATPTRVRL
jgi:hypothetical protein